MASNSTASKASTSKAKPAKAKPETPEEMSIRLREDLAKAKDLLDQRRSDLVEAAELVNEINADWSKGNDNFTDAEKIAADTRFDRLDKWVRASELEVSRLEKRQINLSIELAEAMVPAVEKALYGLVPVVAQIGKEPRPGEVENPSVVITQEEPTADNRGVLTGKVTASFYRSPVFSKMDEVAISKHAGRLGLHIGSIFNGTSPHGDDVIVDRCQMRVSGFTGLPVIGEPATEAEVNGYVSKVRSAVVFAADVKASSTYTSRSSVLATANVENTDTEVVIEDGTRTTTVTTTIRFKPYHHGGLNVDQAGMSNANVVQDVRDSLTSMIGDAVPGLGVVANVETDTRPVVASAVMTAGEYRVTVTSVFEASVK